MVQNFLKLARFHSTIYFVTEVEVQTSFSLIHTKLINFKRICTKDKSPLFSKSRAGRAAPVTLTCALMFVLIFKRVWAVQYYSWYELLHCNHSVLPNIDAYRQDLEALFEIAGRDHPKKDKRRVTSCRTGTTPWENEFLERSTPQITLKKALRDTHDLSSRHPFITRAFLLHISARRAGLLRFPSTETKQTFLINIQA
jgi:hypothetical protein